MAALAMALVVGLALASGPERISSEAEQRLAVNGHWEGTWQTVSVSTGILLTSKATLKPGLLTLNLGGEVERLFCRFVDEGKGRCRMVVGKKSTWLGIYKREGERLIICLDDENSGHRPATFQADKVQSLLTIRPAPAGK